MANKRRDVYNRYHRTEAKKSRMMLFLDGGMLIFTLFSALLLLCAYLSRYVSPANVWFFSFVGLVAPILYVVNIAIALFWTIRWRAYVIIPVLVLVVGWGGISLFFRPLLNKEKTEINKKATVVMSYNAMGFIYEDKNKVMVSSLGKTLPFIAEQKPDIVCLQEFQSKSAEQKQTIDNRIGLEYNVVNYKMQNSLGGGWGVAIYSRHAIVASGNINFPNSNNSALWADVVVRGDTIRVFNNHLQTTSVDGSDRQYIANHEFIQDNEGVREERVRGILSKLKRNYIRRAAQVDSLAPIIRESPHKVIVCGDFNDTPMSYTYHKMRGDLRDTFVERGQGVDGSTYKGLFNLFRIDYIMHSPEIKTHNYATPISEYSDHKAIVVSLGLPSTL